MIKALIVGGGVAGPVAAMALRRAGFDAIVYEAHAQTSKDVGSYLTVATNGLDALRALNAHQPVMSAGFPTRYIVLLSGTGKRLEKVPIRGTLPDGSVSRNYQATSLAPCTAPAADEPWHPHRVREATSGR
jgi:FAD-dependent urate hydroxylase